MTALQGWGIDPYATSSWGASVIGNTSLVNAFAINTTEVRVVLNGEPKHSSAAGTGDALNPASWTVQRLDTAELLEVIAVREVDEVTYIITTIQAFGSARVTHVLSSNSLLDIGGAAIVPPRSAEFLGMLDPSLDPLNQPVERRFIPRDIANPQTTDASIGGTLVVSDSGDYESVFGVELVKKLIIRRLSTAPGGFFHLPNYGVGIRTKGLLPGGGLVKLKQEIELQILREPEVEVVNATLTQDGNTLIIIIRARLKPTGESLEVTIPVDAGKIIL